MGDGRAAGVSPRTDPSRPSTWRGLLWALVAVLCLGLVGLLLALPPVRRRRAARARGCEVCRRQRRRRRIAALAFTALLVVGAGGRAWAVVDPPTGCSIQTSPQEQERPDTPLVAGPEPLWDGARDTLTAPVSGLALLASGAAGMSTCDGEPVLVTFWPGASGGGTTVGDTFVAWMPPEEARGDRLDGLGVPAGSMPFEDVEGLPFGPNISANRTQAAQLTAHESRHTDQWAGSTLLAGPLAYPVAYYLDNSLFPAERNHFERDAGLEAGGYDAPPPTDPAPRWGTLAVIALAALLLLRRRLRWSSRVVRGGRDGAAAHARDRCPLHTPGWFTRER